MKIVAIIQARMGSTRLPGKMMMMIAGKPVIQHVFERVIKSELVDEVWLATTTNTEDDVLAEWASRRGIMCYRGSNGDVLDRYYQASRLAQADAVVRVTGDCPLIDPQVIDQAISLYRSHGFVYVSNSCPPTYPDGLDVEVFSAKTLNRAWTEASLASEREHVTPYIWKHPELFQLGNLVFTQDLSHYRWTLDTLEDFDFIKLVVEACAVKKGYSGMNDILSLLKEHPGWVYINGHYNRNEGYIRSLKSDEDTLSS